MRSKTKTKTKTNYFRQSSENRSNNSLKTKQNKEIFVCKMSVFMSDKKTANLYIQLLGHNNHKSKHICAKMSSSIKLAENLKPFKTTCNSQLCIIRCKTSRLHKFLNLIIHSCTFQFKHAVHLSLNSPPPTRRV